MKNFKINQIIAIILFLVVSASFSYFVVLEFFPPKQKDVIAVIPDGSSVNDISKILLEKNVINNQLIFKFYVFSSGKTEHLMPGRYTVKQSTPYRELINVLLDGPKKSFYNFTVVEGFTLSQIENRLSRIGGLSSKEFNVLTTDPSLYDYDFLKSNTSKSLEGYLFPETYRFDADTQISDAIEVMLKQFEKEYKAIKDRKMPVKLSLHQITTIASMIEREARIQEEQPIISAVIYNRLKKKMRLEICSTVLYALGNRKKELFLKDLKINSPYNTYKFTGLPPTPISSPGRGALKAALKPANVDYLYYVLVDEKKGTHFFTNDYQKFLKAKHGKKLK